MVGHGITLCPPDPFMFFHFLSLTLVSRGAVEEGACVPQFPLADLVLPFPFVLGLWEPDGPDASPPPSNTKFSSCTFLATDDPQGLRLSQD